MDPPPTVATPTPAEATTQRPPGRDRTWAWVAGGVGVAGVLTGSIAGAIAIDKKNTVNAQCQGMVCTQAGKDAGDSGRTFATVSTVGFVVGGVGLAAAAVLWVLAPMGKPEATARWRVMPSVSLTPGQTVFSIQGAL